MHWSLFCRVNGVSVRPKLMRALRANQWFEVGDHSMVVGYTDLPNDKPCRKCNQAMDTHGYIPPRYPTPQQVVCPGDFVLFTVHGSVESCRSWKFELIEPTLKQSKLIDEILGRKYGM